MYARLLLRISTLRARFPQTPLSYRRNERGVTLVEILISTVIVAIIGGSIASALLFVVRSESDVSDRLGTARVGHSLSTFFPTDVATTDPRLATGPTDPGVFTGTGGWDCTGPKPGSDSDLVVRFTATGFRTGDLAPSTRSVYYWVAPGTPPAGWKLSRYECVPGQPSSETRIAARLKAANGVNRQVTTTAGLVTAVSLEVEAVGINGTTQKFKVSASPRTKVSP
jgi:Prokaryotic N-terminal methylation motif